MRVCIVGASGKLGQYMVQHALDRGYEVVGVCRELKAVVIPVGWLARLARVIDIDDPVEACRRVFASDTR